MSGGFLRENLYILHSILITRVHNNRAYKSTLVYLITFGNSPNSQVFTRRSSCDTSEAVLTRTLSLLSAYTPLSLSGFRKWPSF